MMFQLSGFYSRYQPGKVTFQSDTFERPQLLALCEKMVHSGQEALSKGPKRSASNKENSQIRADSPGRLAQAWVATKQSIGAGKITSNFDSREGYIGRSEIAHSAYKRLGARGHGTLRLTAAWQLPGRQSEHGGHHKGSRYGRLPGERFARLLLPTVDGRIAEAADIAVGAPYCPIVWSSGISLATFHGRR
eukprot:s1167_g2.t1